MKSFIDALSEFIKNLLAGLIAVPLTLIYMAVCAVGALICCVGDIVRSFKEVFIVALIVLLIIDGARWSVGVSVAIVVITVLLAIFCREECDNV